MIRENKLSCKTQLLNAKRFFNSGTGEYILSLQCIWKIICYRQIDRIHSESQESSKLFEVLLFLCAQRY